MPDRPQISSSPSLVLKQHPELASPQPKAPAAEDKEDNEDGSGMMLVEDTQPKDMVAAAFDDPNPQSIIVGHGKLAFTSDYMTPTMTPWCPQLTLVLKANKQLATWLTPPLMALLSLQHRFVAQRSLEAMRGSLSTTSTVRPTVTIGTLGCATSAIKSRLVECRMWTGQSNTLLQDTFSLCRRRLYHGGLRNSPL